MIRITNIRELVDFLDTGPLQEMDIEEGGEAEIIECRDEQFIGILEEEKEKLKNLKAKVINLYWIVNDKGSYSEVAGEASKERIGYDIHITKHYSENLECFRITCRHELYHIHKGDVDKEIPFDSLYSLRKRFREFRVELYAHLGLRI